MITKILFKPITFLILGALLLESGLARGQSLPELMQQAEANYPAILLQKAKASQAEAQVALEKNTLMPSLDAAYQANLATYNNITGMNLPGQLIPISGPPSTENFNVMVPGTAASLLMRWTPFTFGQRNAATDAKTALLEKELAGVENEILKVQYEVGKTYLDLLATQELIQAYQKNIERTEFNLRQVRSLVISGIRPGVDSVRFRGELSRAKSELIQLQSLFESQKIQLAELLVSSEEIQVPENSVFSEKLPLAQLDFSSSSNPLLKMAQSELSSSQSTLTQLKRAWTPKLEFWGTTYARGSGIDFNGVVNKADGWSFSRYNYGFGAQIVFPILDLSRQKILKTQQEAVVKAAESQLRQTQVSLQSREARAQNEFLANLEMAKEVPLELEASEAAFKAIQTRYNAGLVDYSELIQTQNELFFAEAKLKAAYLNTWKSLLLQAATLGNMDLFLTQIDN
jgi:outer membrane protein